MARGRPSANRRDTLNKALTPPPYQAKGLNSDRPRMAGAETTVERLRRFLRELSPGARSLLIGELERSVLRGEDVVGGDLVLHELRRIVREQRDTAPRIEDSARLLFKPLEPFIVDDRGDHKHPGRIARSSLDSLWNWIRRDLLPHDADALGGEGDEAMVAGDQAKTARPARQSEGSSASH